MMIGSGLDPNSNGVERSEPIRVALDVMPLLGPPTGIHQATLGLLKSLLAHDNITPLGYVLAPRTRRKHFKPIENLGIEVKRTRTPMRVCIASWPKWRRPKLRKVLRHADVIHGTNYTAPPSPRSLITVQDFTPITHYEQWCVPTVKQMGEALLGSVKAGAHVHVTTNANAAAAPDVLGVPPERVHVVPLGLRDLLQGDKDVARQIVGSERFVLALGTTEPRKNLTILPAAVAALPSDVKLVVAGPAGSDELPLRRAVSDCGLSDRFVRLDPVSEKLKSDLLHGASMLVYSSLLEGFGLPPLEAVLADTPVVATAVGALPELLEPEIPLVPPGDSDALSQRIADTLTRPPTNLDSVRSRLAALTWDGAANQFSSVYRTVLKAL